MTGKHQRRFGMKIDAAFKSRQNNQKKEFLMEKILVKSEQICHLVLVEI